MSEFCSVLNNTDNSQRFFFPIFPGVGRASEVGAFPVVGNPAALPWVGKDEVGVPGEGDEVVL